MRASFKYLSNHQLATLLKAKEVASFSYPEIKGTQSEKIEGYDNDLNTILLGTGDEVWARAKIALNRWQQFPPSWTRIYDETTPLKTGNTVLVLFKLFVLWWLNAARIVYDFDDENRYGFAYGTLDGHVESGEECFWIDRNKEGQVYYHIKAFSKPKFWGARLTYPMSRRFQRKFVLESMARMKALATSKTNEI